MEVGERVSLPDVQKHKGVANGGWAVVMCGLPQKDISNGGHNSRSPAHFGPKVACCGVAYHPQINSGKRGSLKPRAKAGISNCQDNAI